LQAESDSPPKYITRPLFGRLGGKSRIATDIVDYFPAHRVYVEPMIGGGSVLYAKPRSEKEVVGDLDPRVVTLFKAAQQGTHCEDTVTSQEEERQLVAEKSEDACDIYKTIKCSFAKKGFHPGRPEDYPCIVNWPPAEQANRLDGVVVEHGDYRATMQKYDGPNTLHYLDPPYVGTRNEYGPGLDNVKPEEVKETALSMRGSVVISYNDVPRVRETFCLPNSGFQCHEIEQVILGTSKGAIGKRKDLVIIKD
jgi:DNA adenine methylase